MSFRFMLNKKSPRSPLHLTVPCTPLTDHPQHKHIGAMMHQSTNHSHPKSDRLTHDTTNDAANDAANSTTTGKLLLLSTLAASISACQSVPPAGSSTILAEPNIPINQPYPVADSDTLSTNKQPSIASQRWQDYYTDKRLQTLIAMGLKNNKDMKNAILAIQRARAQYRINDIRDVPSINGSTGYEISSTRGLDDPHDSYSVNLAMANYEFDFWGKVSSLKEQALQNYLATTAAKDAAQIALISNIAQAYVNLSYNMAQLALANATVESREQSLFIAQKRFEAGVDPKLPSLQAEASLENAKIAVYRAQSQVQTSINALQYLIGAPVPEVLIPKSAVTDITSIQTAFNAGLPSELLHYRPDVLQAEYSLKAAGANIEVARSAYFPSISLSGRIGTASGDLTDLFKSSSMGWSFGPSISVPIFDNGSLDAGYQDAKLAQQQALTNYEKTIQTAFKEVADVLARRATLDQQLTSQYKLQNNFDQSYQIADARFKAGLSNYLDVLDSERSKFAAQQSILELELAKVISQIQLYQVLGGGANLSDGVVIPVEQYPNLVNITSAANSATAKAEQAIKAAGSATVASPEQAEKLRQENPADVTVFEAKTIVDLNEDGNTDAVVGTLIETPTILEDSDTNTDTNDSADTDTPIAPQKNRDTADNNANAEAVAHDAVKDTAKKTASTTSNTTSSTTSNTTKNTTTNITTTVLPSPPAPKKYALRKLPKLEIPESPELNSSFSHTNEAPATTDDQSSSIPDDVSVANKEQLLALLERADTDTPATNTDESQVELAVIDTDTPSETDTKTDVMDDVEQLAEAEPSE